MQTGVHHSSRRRRGAGVIGLLMALVIIAILTIFYMQKQPTGDGAGNISPGAVRRDLDRTKAVACQANRVTAQTQMMGWTMANPGRPATVEALRAGGVTLPACPDGGELSVGAGGQIFCSLHQPDPNAPPPTRDGGEAGGAGDEAPFPPRPMPLERLPEERFE